MSLPGQSGEGGEPPHYLHHHLANILETWLMCIVFIQREVKRVYRMLLDEDKEFLGLKIDSG